MPQKSSFTLIELLVVVAIMSLISSIVLISLNTARIRSRDARRKVDLRQIRMALEMYFDANGYYPQSGCGYDCNGYRVSYGSASWEAFQSDLSKFIPKLPVDPKNSSCSPWTQGCLSYAYGNVGRYTYRHQYDLTAQLEDSTDPDRCGVKNYRFFFNAAGIWCTAFGGSYSNQIYEASPM